MALETPGCPAANALPPLASRFLKVAELPWKETQVPGIDMKILMQDKENGLLTALFRWQPGTELPLHEHVEVEQTLRARRLDRRRRRRSLRRRLCLAAARQSPHRPRAQRRAGPQLLPETQPVHRRFRRPDAGIGRRWNSDIRDRSAQAGAHDHPRRHPCNSATKTSWPRACSAPAAAHGPSASHPTTSSRSACWATSPA